MREAKLYFIAKILNSFFFIPYLILDDSLIVYFVKVTPPSFSDHPNPTMMQLRFLLCLMHHNSNILGEKARNLQLCIKELLSLDGL